MAANVLTLNSRVPTSCTAVACQSIWPGRNTKTFRRAVPGRRGAASTASRYCRNPAEVKNSDPMKNVTASGVAPTAFTYAGTVPSPNRNEPTANSTPIHQSRSCGAHHVEPRGSAPCRCLRCARDSQCAITPSGRLRTTKVTNGPNPRSVIVAASADFRGPPSSVPLTASEDGVPAAGRHHPARMRSRRQQAAQVGGALPDVGDRAFAAGLIGQDGVLFQDIPAAVVAAPQVADDGGEVDVTAAQRPVHAAPHRLGVGQHTRPD